MQWNQTPCDYLHRSIRSVQNQEQTLELRLPEGMPDIGRVLCAWGQPILRSKELRADSMTVAGGVSAWVLYMPEDGSQPQSIECWLPFQAKWNVPESKREGIINANCLLRSVDARTLSARKLMVRCTASILAEFLVPAGQQVYTAKELPQDVQVLENTYPLALAKEAGEKQFAVDEELSLSADIQKLIAWDVSDVVSEQTVVGGRALWKGNCRLHLVTMDSAGKMESSYYDLPFAQYAELDRDYDKEATVEVMVAVSSLEPELIADKLHVKCNMVAQYTVYDNVYLTVAEDAYSPWRKLEVKMDALELPVLLDQTAETVQIQSSAESELVQIVDAVYYPDQPAAYREAQTVQIELPGVVQILGYDGQGNLQCRCEAVTQQISLPASEGCTVSVDLCLPEQPGIFNTAGSWQFQIPAKLRLCTHTQMTIPMLTDLQLGETAQPDPNRPSLILRRMEDMSLWEMAKYCGSTVDAIRKANHLTAEPEPGQMLLIPVC